MDVAKRVSNLRDIIMYHRKRYYVDCDSDVHDSEYDLLEIELKELERERPDLITADSSTQNLGSDLASSYLETHCSKCLGRYFRRSVYFLTGEDRKQLVTQYEAAKEKGDNNEIIRLSKLLSMCPECDARVYRQAGCATCLECGWSACQ